MRFAGLSIISPPDQPDRGCWRAGRSHLTGAAIAESVAAIGGHLGRLDSVAALIQGLADKTDTQNRPKSGHSCVA